MHIVTLRLQVPPDQRKKILDAARLFVGPTQVQPGCISCRFYQDMNEPNAIFFVEEWKSRKTLEEHLKSNQYRIILSLMELSNEVPEFKLNTVSNIEGLEAIENVRVDL